MRFDLPRMLVTIQFVMFAILFGVIIWMPFSEPSIFWAIGLILAMSGVIIGLVAIQEHNRTNNHPPSVSPRPVNQRELVTTGLYKRIRHPIYTGVILAAVGLAMIHGNIISLIIAFSFIPFFTYKSTVEEQYLRQHYPNYAEYMTRSGRFLPRI